MIDQSKAVMIWKDAVEQVKDRTMHPSLWRALDVSHGITLENDTFVIGFNSPDYPQASILRSAQHKTVIEKVLAQAVGLPSLRIRTIEGTTLAEYEQVRKTEEAFEAERRAVLERKEVEKSTGRSWESVVEEIMKMHSSMNLRQLPQRRAKFMCEALKLISQAMDRICGDNPDDTAERALARVIDKVAVLIDAPSIIVANELLRMRSTS